MFGTLPAWDASMLVGLNEAMYQSLSGTMMDAWCAFARTGRRVLFEPLGFGPNEWTVDRVGEPHAASGLCMLPCDTLKVGQLVLANGAWSGRQIVPAEWV
jgi:hypothetical protein